MKFFLTICTLAVIGALVAPFFLQVNGQPIMTVDEVIEDSTPDVLREPTTVYRWKDASGRVQFGDAPPAHGNAQTLNVQERLTRMDGNWHGDAPSPSQPAKQLPVPGIAGYVDGGKQLMEQAKSEVETLNKRTEKLEQMRQSLQ